MIKETNQKIEIIPPSLFEKAIHLAALIQNMEPSCRRLFCELLEKEMHPPTIYKGDSYVG